MSVKLLTEHHLEFLCLTGGYTLQARMSLHMSKCHIVRNHMSRLNFESKQVINLTDDICCGEALMLLHACHGILDYER